MLILKSLTHIKGTPETFIMLFRCRFVSYFCFAILKQIVGATFWFQLCWCNYTWFSPMKHGIMLNMSRIHTTKQWVVQVTVSKKRLRTSSSTGYKGKIQEYLALEREQEASICHGFEIKKKLLSCNFFHYWTLNVLSN